MSITITSKRIKFHDGSGSYLSQDVIINGECCDLNYFTDSGNWIKAMKISKDGKKLTVFIDIEWYAESESHYSKDSVICKMKQRCDKDGIEFPFTEVTFKFVDSDYGIIWKDKKVE